MTQEIDDEDEIVQAGGLGMTVDEVVATIRNPGSVLRSLRERIGLSIDQAARNMVDYLDTLDDDDRGDRDIGLQSADRLVDRYRSLIAAWESDRDRPHRIFLDDLSIIYAVKDVGLLYKLYGYRVES